MPNCWDNTNHKYSITLSGKGPTCNLTLPCKDKVLGGPLEVKVNFATQSFLTGFNYYFTSNYDWHHGPLGSGTEIGSGRYYNITFTDKSFDVLSGGGLVLDASTRTWTAQAYNSNSSLLKIYPGKIDLSYHTHGNYKITPTSAYHFDCWYCTAYITSGFSDVRFKVYKNSNYSDWLCDLADSDIIQRRWYNNSGYVHNYWFINNNCTNYFGDTLYVKDLYESTYSAYNQPTILHLSCYINPVKSQ